jgi:hypothetical protein
VKPVGDAAACLSACAAFTLHKGILISEFHNLVTILGAPFYFLLDPALVPVFRREARCPDEAQCFVQGLGEQAVAEFAKLLTSQRTTCLIFNDLRLILTFRLSKVMRVRPATGLRLRRLMHGFGDRRDFERKFARLAKQRRLHAMLLFDSRPSHKAVQKFAEENLDWIDQIARSTGIYFFVCIRKDGGKAVNPCLEIASLFRIRADELPGVLIFNGFPTENIPKDYLPRETIEYLDAIEK